MYSEVCKLKQRALRRLEEDQVDEESLLELCLTVKDRLCLRLGENQLPKMFESVCVDAIVKAYRRVYYEGITTEGVANLTTSFVDDILAEYALEISSWIEKRANESGSGKKLRFL